MKGIVTCFIILSSMICNSQSTVMVYENFDELKIEVLDVKEDDITYVINFWATWCGPCVKELPYFVQLKEEYKDQKVEMIFVSLDFPKQMESKLLPFINEMGITDQTILLNDANTNEWIDKVSTEWSGAIPITIIQKNKEKEIILEAVHDYDELKNYFKKIYNN